jgi:hypothetical protein
MTHVDYFYGCSRDYVDQIESTLYEEVTSAIGGLPKRSKQAEINQDLFWLLTSRGWAYDTLGGVSDSPPSDLGLEDVTRANVEKRKDRNPCLTSSTLGTRWHCDFAKKFPVGLVQIEAQFGKVESMFKDFCGFRLAYHERRLALGIEIVLADPSAYFAHRLHAIGGMAYFAIAKETLPAIGLNVPVWLIGIVEG